MESFQLAATDTQYHTGHFLSFRLRLKSRRFRRWVLNTEETEENVERTRKFYLLKLIGYLMYHEDQQ